MSRTLSHSEHPSVVIIVNTPFRYVELSSLFLWFVGGLLCFSLRCNELNDYQPKMLELEKEGRWEKLCRETVPYFERDDLPREGLAFVYRVKK